MIINVSSFCSCIPDKNKHLPQFVVSDFENADSSHLEAYEVWPWGTARKIIPKGSKFDLQQWLVDSLRLLPNYTIGMQQWHDGYTHISAEESTRKYPFDSWEKVVMGDFWEDRHRRAWYDCASIHDELIVMFVRQLLMYAIEHDNDRWCLERAAEIIEELIVDNPHPKDYMPHLFKNLGITYARLGKGKV